MADFFLLMGKPLLACLVLAGIHGYLGIHVVERKVIFVDLALAQIAALGASTAFLFGHDLHGPVPYVFSLAATFLGAGVFALTRTRREKIPQEAVIGIVYAVSAALAILILSRAAEGDEHIRYMMIGNILLVSGPEILKMFALYAVIGLIHIRFRNAFILISTHPEQAYQKKLPVRLWDLAFYLTFGAVVTSSVQTAGVLLVFSFLVVPAVGAVLFFKKFSSRLIFGWALGIAASLFGTAASYRWDLPTGAAIVCAFGGLLLFLALLRLLFARFYRPAADN